jgi:hypothetical protein
MEASAVGAKLERDLLSPSRAKARSCVVGICVNDRVRRGNDDAVRSIARSDKDVASWRSS